MAQRLLVQGPPLALASRPRPRASSTLQARRAAQLAVSSFPRMTRISSQRTREASQPPRATGEFQVAAAAAEPQGQLAALLYAALAGAWAIVGAAALLAPVQVVELLWAASPNHAVIGFLRLTGTTFVLAGIIAHCLKGAAEHGRLKSETYRRLNLGLTWWGALLLAALWVNAVPALPAAQWALSGLAALTSAGAASVYQRSDPKGLDPSYLWGQSLKGVQQLVDYSQAKPPLLPIFTYGFMSKAAATLALTLALGTARTLQAWVLLQPLGALGTEFVRTWAAGLLLLALALFTLKDAALRGRLGASTFRALNLGAGFAAAFVAVAIVRSSYLGILRMPTAMYAKLAAWALLAGVSWYEYSFAKK